MDNAIDGLVSAYDTGLLSRRQLVARLAGLAGVLAAAPVLAQGDVPAPPADAPAPTFHALDLNHIALRVTDIARSRDYYRKHLGLTVASESAGSCFLRCGQRGFLALFRADKPAMDHYCYSVSDYDAAGAVKRLEAAGLAPRRQGDRVYFDDPDGLEVQVAAIDHRV
jgi:catechol 2,3-dioxygenase-like lactoylglutathione lyase family enzyme